MELKNYLVYTLNLPLEYVDVLDFTGIPMIQRVAQRWVKFYKLVQWADLKEKDTVENKELFDRFIAYCVVKAAKDFADKVIAEGEMLDWLTKEIREEWAAIFLRAAALYEKGEKGVPCDGEMAVFFYEKVPMIDPLEPTYPYGLIGDVYYHGYGIAPDYQKALEYYRMSEQDYLLGDYYSEGIAVTPDYPLAIDYYLKTLKICVDEENISGEEYIHEKLAKCYEAIGEKEKAAEHFKRYEELRKQAN